MTKIDSIKVVIGDGGFSAPLGAAHMRAVMRDCKASGWTVFSAIAAHTDFVLDSDTLLKCRGLNIDRITDFTGLSRTAVKDALKALIAAGWLAREGSVTRPT